MAKNTMPEPTLYGWYSAEEAVSLFGSPEDAQHLCNGQWVIFEKTAICLTTIGEKWTASHFDKGSSFYWVADQPYRVSDLPGAKFVPAQVLPSSERKHSIRLFVRQPGAEKYLYAGELASSHVLVESINTDRGAAHFYLTPTLPSKVLAELGGLRPGDLNLPAVDPAMSAHEPQPALDTSGWLPFEGLRTGKPNFESVDLALNRLCRPTLIEDRLSVLQHVVNYWHGPIRSQDGLSDAELAGLRLPAALRWWYRWAGKRSEIMTGQNFLFTPGSNHGQPAMVDDRLFFYAENQGVYQWATLPDGDDPPVFGRYEDTEPWEREDFRVSEHLILACLFEAIMCHAKYGASAAWLDESRLEAIVSHIPPIAIPPWRWHRSRFFAHHRAFMCTAEQGVFEGKKWYSVWIGAKTEHPLQFLKPLLDKSWELVSI